MKVNMHAKSHTHTAYHPYKYFALKIPVAIAISDPDHFIDPEKSNKFAVYTAHTDN